MAEDKVYKEYLRAVEEHYNKEKSDIESLFEELVKSVKEASDSSLELNNKLSDEVKSKLQQLIEDTNKSLNDSRIETNNSLDASTSANKKSLDQLKSDVNSKIDKLQKDNSLSLDEFSNNLDSGLAATKNTLNKFDSKLNQRITEMDDKLEAQISRLMGLIEQTSYKVEEHTNHFNTMNKTIRSVGGVSFLFLTSLLALNGLVFYLLLG